MEETFGNGETGEREMNECGGAIRGGQAVVCVSACVCVRVCRSGGKRSRLAGSSLRRSGPLIKSEGQTGGLPHSFPSPLPLLLPSLICSLAPQPLAIRSLCEVKGRGGGGVGGRGGGGVEEWGGTRAPALGVWLPVETVNHGSAVRPETQTGR